MSIIEIRTAHLDDVPRIGLIMKAVWPHTEPNLESITRVLQDRSHVTLVTMVDGVAAGFVDGFATTTIDSVLRWEVDLLAVHPDFQRQGIGSRLVEANGEAGQKQGARFARGLIAVNNLGSQKAFVRCGYETDGSIHELLVLERPRSSNDMDGGNNMMHLIPVKTMNYAGWWIEGRRQKSNLATAIHRLIGSNHDLAGAVVPENEADVIENARALGFESVGRYQWWQRPLVDD